MEPATHKPADNPEILWKRNYNNFEKLGYFLFGRIQLQLFVENMEEKGDLVRFYWESDTSSLHPLMGLLILFITNNNLLITQFGNSPPLLIDLPRQLDSEGIWTPTEDKNDLCSPQ